MSQHILLTQNLRSFTWQFLQPYKYLVIFYIFLALLAGCWGPFNSILIKTIINDLSSSPSKDIALLGIPAVLLVVNFIVFDNFTWRTIGYLNYKYQRVIKNTIINKTFEFILGSSQQFFHDNLSGKISSHITTLAEGIEKILHRIAADFIRSFSLFTIALISMLYVNPIFFFTILLWFIAFAGFSMKMSKRLVYLSDSYAESESVISGQLVDTLSNSNNIRLFSRTRYEVSRLDTFLMNANRTFQNNELFLLRMNWVQGMLIAVMLAFMVYFLIHLYARNLVSIGDFALILGLSMDVGHMAWYTMSQVDEFNQAVGKCKQSLSVLMVPHQIKDKENAPVLQVSKGQIAFSNVEFFYKGTKPLFQNKSITINASQKVGLVGYSGGGKTSFVNLILRLYEVTKGSILIDGQDIRDVAMDSLHENIALIPQDPTLFHRTLMDNIRYGKVNASDEEVIEAAKKAHAHDFIQKLPQGYDSLVGERGVKLSGGQRQRIAIARAILKNAPILILDEATSQLDSVTEGHIQESLWELMQNKTTIVIAHRLSTLLHMDRVLVFDAGKIVEEGTHQELIEKNGLYKVLWNTQVGGFLQDKKKVHKKSV